MNKVIADKAYVLDFEKPKTSPNSLSASTTQLSFYLSNGILSPRLFFSNLVRLEKEAKGKCSKPPVSLRGQMLWREYNYLHGYAVDNFTKQRNNKIARQIDWDDDPQLLRRWQEVSKSAHLAGARRNTNPIRIAFLFRLTLLSAGCRVAPVFPSLMP